MSTPPPDAMSIYILGPGYGESQVIIFPSGHCLVVDCCVAGGENLTLELLRSLSVPRVDLLIVSHPDLDHIRGIRGLVEAFRPVEAWRFPFGLLRELVAGWCRQNPDDGRWRELSDAYSVLDDLEDQNVACEPTLHTRTIWRRPTLDAEVQCIAPTMHDTVRIRRDLRRLVEYESPSRRREQPGDEPTLATKIQDYLLGERHGLHDHPNAVSLAVAVRWRRRRVLLAGDVEIGSASPHSGWSGILEVLRQDQMLNAVEHLDLVKVAHHGSLGAFHRPAWELHSRPDRLTIAAITPFDRGRTGLPRPAVLGDIRSYAGQLGITADTRQTFSQAVAQGWTREGLPDATLGGPVLRIVLAENGPGILSVSTASGRFRSSP